MVISENGHENVQEWAIVATSRNSLVAPRPIESGITLALLLSPNHWVSQNNIGKNYPLIGSKAALLCKKSAHLTLKPLEILAATLQLLWVHIHTLEMRGSDSRHHNFE